MKKAKIGHSAVPPFNAIRYRTRAMVNRGYYWFVENSGHFMCFILPFSMQFFCLIFMASHFLDIQLEGHCINKLLQAIYIYSILSHSTYTYNGHRYLHRFPANEEISYDNSHYESHCSQSRHMRAVQRFSKQNLSCVSYCK